MTQAGHQPSDHDAYTTVTEQRRPLATRRRLAVEVLADARAACPRVVVIAWGQDTGDAMHALQLARSFAADRGWTVKADVTTACPLMGDAFLRDVADTRALAREIDYGHAWWAVPHSAVSPIALERIRTAQRQRWNLEESQAAHGEDK